MFLLALRRSQGKFFAWPFFNFTWLYVAEALRPTVAFVNLSLICRWYFRFGIQIPSKLAIKSGCGPVGTSAMRPHSPNPQNRTFVFFFFYSPWIWSSDSPVGYESVWAATSDVWNEDYTLSCQFEIAQRLNVSCAATVHSFTWHPSRSEHSFIHLFLSILMFFLFLVFRRMGCLGSKDRLTKEDMEFLKSHTRYDEVTIKEWYKGFKVSWRSHRIRCNDILPRSFNRVSHANNGRPKSQADGIQLKLHTLKAQGILQCNGVEHTPFVFPLDLDRTLNRRTKKQTNECITSYSFVALSPRTKPLAHRFSLIS